MYYYKHQQEHIHKSMCAYGEAHTHTHTKSPKATKALNKRQLFQTGLAI